MTQLNELVAKEFDKMELFTVAITRAHGQTHPETFQVRDLYVQLTQALENNEATEAIFQELRTITNNYEVPGDTCDTHKAVYHHLAQYDQLAQD